MTRRDVARSAAAALLTDRPLQFLRYETVSLAGPRAVTYTLRGRQGSAVVRHGSHDVDRLIGAFGRRVYTIPAPARELLRTSDRLQMLDLGAGPGMTALALLEQHPTARVTSVEPDPINGIILRRTMRANPRFTGWTEILAAAGDGSYLTGPGYGRFGPKMTEERRRARAEALDLSTLLRECDVLALNIQGAEWDVLGDGRLAGSAAQVVFLEPHARGCPEPDPAACAGRMLSAAGFRIVSRANGPKVLLCAWRPGAAGGRG
jgi:FkbM family methyltransferase